VKGGVCTSGIPTAASDAPPVRRASRHKGRFAPPPKLKAAAQRVSEAVAAWQGVHARTHWLLGDEREVDGADFYLGENEVGQG